MFGRRADAVVAWVLLYVRRLGWFYGLGIALAACALVGFAKLADDVAEEDSRRVNLTVLQTLHAQANPLLDRLALALTALGGVAGTTVVTCLAVVFFLWRRRWLDAVALALLVLGGAALVTVLKQTVRQPRPDLFESLAPESGFSFPSGHALLAVCVYGYLAAVLVLEDPRRWWRWCGAALLILLALGIAWSRLYLGVHWLTDVAAGGLVAICWTACCLMARQFAQKRLPARPF
jgi:undecaprenyl-diphosphatase